MDHYPDSLSKLLDEYYEIEDEFADAEARYESDREEILRRIHHRYLNSDTEDSAEVLEEIEDLLEDEGLELRDDVDVH